MGDRKAPPPQPDSLKPELTGAAPLVLLPSVAGIAESDDTSLTRCLWDPEEKWRFYPVGDVAVLPSEVASLKPGRGAEFRADGEPVDWCQVVLKADSGRDIVVIGTVREIAKRLGLGLTNGKLAETIAAKNAKISDVRRTGQAEEAGRTGRKLGEP